ncbi:GGDEF domain-containing protein [Microbaculum marinum]|uniref:diguanylate cyclase n=1 Tax=Microbaculum marinum TaxID=1764581 RepID=A0AAW9RD14_9HYPH
MTLDLSTLTAAGALVALVTGLLLALAWLQFRGGRAALLLGASHLLTAGAVLLLAFGAQQPFLTFLAQPAFVLAAFLALSAVMAFEHRESRLAVSLCAASGVAVLFALRAGGAELALIRVIQLAIVAGAFFAAAGYMWRGRGEYLIARIPMTAVLLLHALMITVGLTEDLLDAALPSGIPSFSKWYGLIYIESMIYLIGSALFMVALLKERGEARHRLEAMTDPLTGLPNRRAFLASCTRTLAHQTRDSLPCSLIAIDLDRFKAVNDTFGHGVGDAVLQVFADAAQQTLRPLDIIGRIGGEEFAVLLPGTHGRQALVIAERIRSEFSSSARRVNGFEVKATLSAGVAVVVRRRPLAEAMEMADAALYRAKLNGRDCVVLDDTEQRPQLLGAAS